MEGTTDGKSFLDSFMRSPDRLRILERAVDSARNGIIITDPSLPDNPIVYANKAFLQLTGYELDDVLGRNCRFLQGADTKQEHLELVRSAIASARPITALLKNYRKDGTPFWNELSVSPIFDAHGKLINFIGVQHDVTARIEAERRVSEFHSIVSHELRTPLSSIRASLGLIADGDAGSLNPQAERLVDIALKNSVRLLQLIDDILDLKKMEAGKLELAMDLQDADEILDEVLNTLNLIANEAGVKLIKEKNTTERIKFQADKIRIVQVLSNLVSNAIKFSSPESRVLIRADVDQDSVRFSVVDSGIGISSSDQRKLFTKFQQIDSSDTRAKTGTGLGLVICKMLVEMHGGSLGVVSAPAKGSTFWFSLPRSE